MDRQAHEYAAAAYAQQKAAALAAAAAAQHQYAVASGGASPFPPQYGTHGVIGQPPPPPHFIPHHAPPHPHHLPHLQPQQNFPAYSHHAQMPPHHQIPLPYTNIPQLHHPPPLTPSPQQQHHISAQQFFNPWDPTPAPVLPPADPELQKRIDKLAEYAAKNGPEFENMIREKQQDNPDYAFLFGAEGHSYYRYKLWLFCTRPFPPPPHHVGLNPLGSGTSAFPSGGAGGGFYDQHGMGQGVYPRVEYDGREREREKSKFKGLSGPLPSDVAAELNSVLVNLSGTKESIKGAKSWFMQRSPFAPALAEALKDRVMVLDDPERQLHIIYVANDILFDSLQRRSNIKELDNEALAFQPVLGPMLAKIYHNPQNKDANQSRLQKILQFWGSKEVYDSETIYNLEGDMIAGPPAGVGHSKDNMAKDLSIGGFAEKEQQDRSITPPQYFGSAAQFSSSQPFATSTTNSVYSSGAQAFPSSVTSAAVQPPLQATNAAMPRGENQPPYPLFPPGLIPGMVRKMQIGSGVPYSPLSPLDIPTVIPPSTASPNYILERVSKFFKDIGEVNPIEGQAEDEEEREPPRTGGACIPPPATLHVDPDTGMLPDGSVPSKKGSNSGRLGLGATADPNEVSQYDDVYTSYRKQRSTNYHTSMSARASAK